MIKLYGFGPSLGLIDPSPFVIKVDAFLRISGTPYQLIGNPNALRKAPKGKLPMIEDEGQIVADSYFIFEHLKDKYKLTLDDHLSSEQQGVAHLVSKSLDENFYWCLVHSRWVREDTWPLVKHAIFAKMPWLLRMIIPGVARSGVKSTLKKHGIGKHSETELLQIFEHSLKSLQQILGDKPYFFGDKVSSFDATAYAFLSSFILADLNNPFNIMARSYQALVDFCQRFQQEYYSKNKQAIEETGTA